MVGTNEMTRNLLAQEPGRVDCHALAADTQIIAQRKPARHNGGTAYSVTTTDGVAFVILVSGRTRWSLDQLLGVSRIFANGWIAVNQLNSTYPTVPVYVSQRGVQGRKPDNICNRVRA